ncbi:MULTISPECIES: cyclic lactone autoinducer peptide [Ruminococcus]|jgi:cyclic lactone autoinducer peptide|uniref:cyclic lactone autoinducer peptide n=1 Tax=Ruminococcus TaxID=1263 RepID=UPI0015F34BD8|nr:MULTISPECIES: cyclic lactone autoinducer peptide [Ruminococcus]
MSNSNKIILKSVAKLAKSAARCASGAASFFDFHQPKEPENLKAMLNSEEKK